MTSAPTPSSAPGRPGPGGRHRRRGTAAAAAAAALATAGLLAASAAPASAADDAKRFDGRAIVIATGASDHLVDSVSAGPLAAALATSVVLSEPTRLGDATAARVKESQPATVYLVGGTDVVPPQVEADVKAALPGAAVVRLAGDDRYATANAVSAEVDAFWDYVASDGSGATATASPTR